MMDNCLASNSETGGVGCDNMTMIVIAFLRGRTKEEWYEEVARRVANGDGPCAPPEYGMCPRLGRLRTYRKLTTPAAEFRGPGVHHSFDDSDSGYDVDTDSRSRPFGNNNGSGPGGYRGRIIFLGDGSEVLTDSDDTEMLDNSEEDKDLASQVSKSSTDDVTATDDGKVELGKPPKDQTISPETTTASSQPQGGESASTTASGKEDERPSEPSADQSAAKPSATLENKAEPAVEPTKTGASDTPSDASDK
jgi:protein phosphatase 2C family protein 2/3